MKDRGIWRAAVHVVAKSQTKQLNNDKLKAIQGTMAGYEAG